MKIEIENAMKVLAKKINDGVEADKALKYTQAALNLAHVLAVQKEAGLLK